MGSGGLGGYYGGLLGAAGHDVTFIARGAHLQALRRQGGVRVRAVGGEFFGPGAAAEAPSSDHADLVLFTVKSYDTASAAEAAAAAVGPQTAVLCLQNGVDNEERLAELYGAERVLGGAVYIFAGIEAPGVVSQTGGPRRVIFGEWRGGESERVSRLMELFTKAGWVAAASADIVRDKWVKFAFICAQAGMTALTRLSIGEIRATPAAWEMFRQIVEEAVSVGRARGVRLPPDLVETHVAFGQRLDPQSRSSLADDLARGRRLEIEALHGTIVRYGRDAGIPTPASAAVYAALLPHDRRARGEGFS